MLAPLHPMSVLIFYKQRHKYRLHEPIGVWHFWSPAKLLSPLACRAINPFQVKPLTKQWINQADYDLATAQAMLNTKRYLYVAFMCQQAVEKLIKGVIQEKTGRTPPYSHNLSMLLKMADISGSDVYLTLLDSLTGYYINSRYPEYKKKLAVKLNKINTETILNETKECFQWLKRESKISERS